MKVKPQYLLKEGMNRLYPTGSRVAVNNQIVRELVIRFREIPYIAVRDRNYPIRQCAKIRQKSTKKNTDLQDGGLTAF